MTPLPVHYLQADDVSHRLPFLPVPYIHCPQDKRRGGVAGRLGGETRDTQGNGDREVYIQSVTDVQVARLTGKGRLLLQ